MAGHSLCTCQVPRVGAPNDPPAARGGAVERRPPEHALGVHVSAREQEAAHLRAAHWIPPNGRERENTHANIHTAAAQRTRYTEPAMHATCSGVTLQGRLSKKTVASVAAPSRRSVLTVPRTWFILMNERSGSAAIRGHA